MPNLIEIFQYISQGQIASHTQELFFEFTLPFIITLIIFFAVLQRIGIFRRKINLVVSLIITILAATTPVFSTIAAWIGQYSGYTALAAFFIVFVIGIGAWAFRRTREYATGTPEEVHNLDRYIGKLEKQLRNETDPRKRMQLARRISEERRIRDEIKHST